MASLDNLHNYEQVKKTWRMGRPANKARVSLPVSLASLPGLPTIQFLIACSMQKRRGEGLRTRLLLLH